VRCPCGHAATVASGAVDVPLVGAAIGRRRPVRVAACALGGRRTSDGRPETRRPLGPASINEVKRSRPRTASCRAGSDGLRTARPQSAGGTAAGGTAAATAGRRSGSGRNGADRGRLRTLGRVSQRSGAGRVTAITPYAGITRNRFRRSAAPGLCPAALSASSGGSSRIVSTKYGTNSPRPTGSATLPGLMTPAPRRRRAARGPNPGGAARPRRARPRPAARAAAPTGTAGPGVPRRPCTA